MDNEFKAGDVIAWTTWPSGTPTTDAARVVDVTGKGPRVVLFGGPGVIYGARPATPAEVAEVESRERRAARGRELRASLDEAGRALRSGLNVPQALAACLRLYGWTCTPPGKTP